MADNLNITSGSGVVIKTDDIGGVHYQQIKLVDGNLDSTSPTGVKDNPLIVSMQNTGATINVTLTNGTVSLLNTPNFNLVTGTVTTVPSGTTSVSGGVTLLSSSPIFVTGGSINVLNTKTNNSLESGGNLDILSRTIYAEDSGHTSQHSGHFILAVRNEGHDDYSGTDKDYVPISVDAAGDVFTYIRHSIQIPVSVTNGTVSLLNTPNFNLVTGTVTAVLSNTGPYNVVVLGTSAPANMSGGVTILSSIYLNVNVNTLTAGTVSLLNTATPGFITGGVTILSSGYLNVNVNTFTAGTVSLLNTPNFNLVTGTVTIVPSGTQTISGGATLLSSVPLAVKPGVRDYVGCTSTWIYAALSSNNATSVWIPAANKRFNITDIVINCLSASAITITQDTAATITIMKLKLMDRGGWVSNFQTPIIASTTNHALVVTSTESGTNSYICVSGYES